MTDRVPMQRRRVVTSERRHYVSDQRCRQQVHWPLHHRVGPGDVNGVVHHLMRTVPGRTTPEPAAGQWVETCTQGPISWYADAWNDGVGGPPAWETFHTTELLQLIERNWGAGDQRVVAGLSMGGFGAMDYAARHPGMFKAAASYSGVMDMVGSQIDNGVATFGDPVAQADNWKAHNPLDLASKLKGIPLYVSYGDGQPGLLDAAGATPSDLEIWIAPQNEAFVARLKELGIPATVDAYGAGTHEWPYWERALHASLPMLLDALGEEPLASESPTTPSAAAPASSAP